MHSILIDHKLLIIYTPSVCLLFICMFDIFDNKLKIHFIGIGGIGISAIAEMMHQIGYYVTGSDCKYSKNIERLEKLGIKIKIPHDANNVVADIVVYSSAIPQDNVELVYAKNNRIPILTRAEMLAQIIRFKKSIIIAGSHGKTTTTSLCASILDMANFAPTVVNGGIINAYQTNVKLGQSEWAVVESDESDGSFTLFTPTIGIITNIDYEHINHYGSYEKLKQSFKQYIANIPFYGCCIACIDDPGVNDVISEANRKIITYGIENKNAIYKAANIKKYNTHTTFDIITKDTVYKDINIPLFGIHNIKNILAAFAMGIELQIDFENIKSAIGSFAGIKRRFSVLGKVKDVTVIDDYAHHPTEIKALIDAARQFSSGKLVLICQPHRTSRFDMLFNEFSQVLQEPEISIILPVYMNDDKNHKHTSVELSTNKDNMYYLDNIEDVYKLLDDFITNGKINKNDLIIFAGAGSISNFAHQYIELH